MSRANIGLKRSGEVLVYGLILTFAIMLVMPSSLPAGPMGDPEPAPPVRNPWSEDDPPTVPEKEDEVVGPFFLARGPMGDPEPAPPVGTPWSEDNPPTVPRGRRDYS